MPTLFKDAMPHALTQTIDALHTVSFTSQLTALIKTIIHFDCAVIIGYRPDKHPIYLFDSIPERRELLFQRYLLQDYQQDPFLVALDQAPRQGVLRMAAVVPPAGYNEYASNFYQRTGWQDELCLAIRLDDARWIVIYLGLLAESGGFSSFDAHYLELYIELLAALCRKQWGNNPLYLSEPLQPDQPISQHIHQAIGSFGQAHLTHREQQVAALMVQGLDSEEIAERLQITQGTVKNHRKRIYAQLGVASLSELFGLFINHAITAPPVTQS